MTIGGRSHHTSPSRSAILVGLTVGVAGLTTGCGTPETGSLENLNKRPPKLDYSKLDYSKIDYSKIDYSKVDYSKVDPAKVDFEKLDEKRKAELAARYVKLVKDQTISDEFVRRMRVKYDNAVKVGDKKLVSSIQEMFKGLERYRPLFSENPARW
jgi:hypothetical protein